MMKILIIVNGRHLIVLMIVTNLSTGNSLQNLLGAVSPALPRSHTYSDVIATSRYQGPSAISPKTPVDLGVSAQSTGGTQKSRKRFAFFVL